MITERYELRSAQPLAEAYARRKHERIDELYGYYSGRERDWQRRYERLDELASLRVSSRDLAAALAAYNDRLEASRETMESIKAIEEGAPVVIGGQQAGLWTGPMLVIHKAVSIIQTAKSASEQLGKRVVPVFWIAGEDHDWDEANHVHVITGEQELSKLTIARPEGPRTSVSRTRLDGAAWEDMLQKLEAALPSSEFKPALLEKLREFSGRSATLTEMFALLLGQLFGSEGLVLLDSDDPGIRRLESPMLRRLIERNDELGAAYAAASVKVRELGYAMQAEVAENSANLFVFHPDKGEERTLLHKQDGLFRDRKGSSSWTKTELLALADSKPESFSNNVLTRPLMQDYLFPVLATVLGPGEIAYWALTGDAFRTLDMEMPIIVPRMSYTLVEGIVAKNMIKYELSFADVMERFVERKAEWLDRQDKLELRDEFETVRDEFVKRYEPLLKISASIQPGLAKLGETNLAKILEQIGYMETKTVDAYNKQFDASLRQLERVRISIAPNGKPQERVLTMLVYWNRYGEEWLRKLLDAPYSRTGGHEIVNL